MHPRPYPAGLALGATAMIGLLTACAMTPRESAAPAEAPRSITLSRAEAAPEPLPPSPINARPALSISLPMSNERPAAEAAASDRAVPAAATTPAVPVAPAAATATLALPVLDPAPALAPAPTAAAGAPPATTSSLTAATSPAPSSTAAAPATAPVALPIDQAVAFAARALFGNADLERFGATAAHGADIPLVIDPLVDGATGFQSAVTQSIEASVTNLVREQFPRFALKPFTAATLAAHPMLFIGTVTPVDKEGKTSGPREALRICLALVDLADGRIVSKGLARAKLDGVDATPSAFFQDSPAWAPDAATQGYVRTCQGTKAGDMIQPAYWDRLVTASIINDATVAYNAGRPAETLALLRSVQGLPGGDQLRVLNGIYLASEKLGRTEETMRAFLRLVDFGLTQKQLNLKFLFRPGSTLFTTDAQLSRAYPTWLVLLGRTAERRGACLEVAGHTSRTGPEPLNERLSLMRAEFIKERIDAVAEQGAGRNRAVGKGSRENISGLGTDDVRDAIDRRVEFRVLECKRPAIAAS